MKTKIALSILTATLALSISGCSGSDNSSSNTYNYVENPIVVVPDPVVEPIEIVGDITINTTWTKENSPYLLTGSKIKVKNGATLTIEPGVTVYGESTAYLIVTQGSKLNANGTSSDPIIFTSEAAFNGATPAAGQWGGVTLLGNAITNEADTIRYEVDEADADFTYGGTDDTDNSGVLNYVQILNSGFAVAPDKEVNGLSLCGVGSGTVIDNITVTDSGDDGIEIWGGAVNLNNISITGAQDDSFDVDSGYHGTVTNLNIVQTEPGAALIEMTNGGDATKQRTDWTLDGFSLTASANQVKEGGIYFKDLDVTASIKNGTINMTSSPATQTSAGLHNKEGVFDSPSIENVLILTSPTVGDIATGDAAGVTLLTQVFTDGVGNSLDSAVVLSGDLTGEIIENTILTKANSPFKLAGNKIKVKNNAILTIEPGVTIYGESTAYLIVTQGSKINANGTSSDPIIFTSEAAFNGATPAAGQWGGVTLLGNAITNEADTIRYEVDEADADFTYGGTDDTDNSGVLNYVQILNSGFAVAPDKEVNGLSLCGVGSGTVIDNITVTDSGDDGIEIWGGAVNLNNLSITGAQDDSFDVDSGYHGTVTNLTVVQTEPGAALIEMTNGGDATKQRTDWTLDGFSLTASANQVKEGGIYFKDLDVTATIKNGTIDMTDSLAADAGLHNKEGVFDSPTITNVKIKGSDTVDSPTSGDAAGVITLNTVFDADVTNTFTEYSVVLTGDLTGEIIENTILTKANSPFKLAGNKIKVKNNAILTIEPGVTIYGESTAYLIVTQGSKLNANGTSSDPIIFTSEAAFNGATPAAGQWGGVTLLGNAITNEADTIRYEVDEADADFTYGGTDDTDNSGVLNYVQILNSGFAVAPDKEVNGLSLCGVGSGTVIDNITVTDSGDDGIEIWGGAVNLNNLSITGAQDDSFDVDSGYHGTVTNLTVVQTEPGAALIEMTNGGDATKQRTDWTLDGFSLTASANQVKEGGIYFKDLDVTASIKNGTIDMTDSLAADAGLHNKEGVFDSPLLTNIQINGSAIVDTPTSGDAAGVTTLNTVFNADVTNTFTSF